MHGITLEVIKDRSFRLGFMDVQLIDKMGSDLTVVNAARVSFDKESDWEYEYRSTGYGQPTKSSPYLNTGDQRLINYLARHGHWTPFSHVQIQMRETVPIFVARQRFKHMVGFTYNEISRRYVDTPPMFYKPDAWRLRAEDKKQGSSNEIVGDSTLPFYYYTRAVIACEEAYNEMLKIGIAPEQARMVLPQSMYTSYYVTGSLAAWARAYKLRAEETAQHEIQILAKEWDRIIGSIPELKYSWKALTND